MGNSTSVFSNEQLEEYQDCTFFTKKEILHIHKRFRQLVADPRRTEDARVPVADIMAIPELRVNPFKHRIVQVGCVFFAEFVCSDAGVASRYSARRAKWALRTSWT